MRDEMILEFTHLFGSDIPEVQIVPALGLYANGGWASGRTVVLAIERVPSEYLDILLAHELTHAITREPHGKVRDQMYREGFATYVSALAAPGHPEELFFFLTRERYDEYLLWIGEHREKILEDSDKPLSIGGALHNFYFSSSRSDYPSIGYLIGYLYAEHLHETHSLSELLTFGTTEQNKVEFEKFWED